MESKKGEVYGMVLSRAAAFQLQNTLAAMSLRDQKLLELIDGLKGVIDANWEIPEVLDVSLMILPSLTYIFLRT